MKSPLYLSAAALTLAASLVLPTAAFSVSEEGQSWQVARPTHRYYTSPLSFDTINVLARAATVNIICRTPSATLRPISASGVIVDSRGVILTNAHIGQYFLLADHPQPEHAVTCTIRTGSPAREKYTAELMYMPTTWVENHASQITTEHAMGTGEEDWALLRITGTTDTSPTPALFPFVFPDIRQTITFSDENVLLASYPAGFLHSTSILGNLFAASTIVRVGQLYTFNDGSVDALSLGGNIVAQAGSSGGAVVNQWGRLTGIITTSSEAATTDTRELRAITLFHVNRSAQAYIAGGLYGLLAQDPTEVAQAFRRDTGPTLANLLYQELSK
jgi:S1-C subfamily serine protease